MRLVLCACGVYLADPENASYVKDGKPMCPAETCAKVKHDNSQNFGRPARDVPVGESWSFPDHRTLAEIDAVPTHIYSKGAYDAVS